MARANRIYIVKERSYGRERNLAAFTVKYELKDWIKKNIPNYMGPEGTWYQVDVIGDGHDLVIHFDIADVMKEKKLVCS